MVGISYSFLYTLIVTRFTAQVNLPATQNPTIGVEGGAVVGHSTCRLLWGDKLIVAQGGGEVKLDSCCAFLDVWGCGEIWWFLAKSGQFWKFLAIGQEYQGYINVVLRYKFG